MNILNKLRSMLPSNKRKAMEEYEKLVVQMLDYHKKKLI